jgi:hypothetical protein
MGDSGEQGSVFRNARPRAHRDTLLPERLGGFLRREPQIGQEGQQVVEYIKRFEASNSASWRAA